MSDVTYKHGAVRKIKKPLGKWYFVVVNNEEQRFFNGLPDKESGLWIPDDNVRKNAEAKVDGYEMVFEVVGVPEDGDLVLDEGQNNFKKVSPIVQVGDIVLVKGTVQKIHSEPIMFAVHRENIVALVKSRDERKNYSPPDDGAVWIEASSKIET